MIRAGLGKPRLRFVPAHNDMSHFTPGHWTTNWYFIMPVDQYIEKYTFSHFDMTPPISQFHKLERQAVLEKLYNGEEITYLDSPWAYRMQSLIKKSGGTQIWQFDAISPYLNGYVRGIVCLGAKELTQWSLFDVYVKLPILELTANLLNFLRKPIMAKENAAWDEYLKEVYKK